MLLENIEETGKRDLKVVKDFVRPPSGKGASVALGLFDGLHIGHRQVLEAAFLPILSLPKSRRIKRITLP